MNLGTLGTNKELYRWHYLIKSNHDRDDYAPLITALSALGQSGAAFLTQTPPLVDVLNGHRALTVPTLFGVVDNYATNSQHNALSFSARRKADLHPLGSRLSQSNRSQRAVDE